MLMRIADIGKGLMLMTLLLLAAVSSVDADASDDAPRYSLRRNIIINDGLYNDEVQDITRDPDGLIWIATRNGLASFDGFKVRNYPIMRVNAGDKRDNDIFCVDADRAHRVYFGTRSNFGIFDKTTERFSYPESGKFKGAGVSAVKVLSDGHTLVGTERGLGIYDPDKDAVIPFGEVYPSGAGINGSIKALMEDDLGHVWIGTWSDGIYRWSPSEAEVYHYPKLNDNNSAHYIMQDSRGDIWVVAWDIGIQRLVDPYNPFYTTAETFNDVSGNLPDKRVYAIGEDPVNRILWICSREGISLMSLDNLGKFHSLAGEGGPLNNKVSETDAIFVDDEGLIWLGSLLSGVTLIDPFSTLFPKWEMADKLPANLVPTVHGIDADSSGNIWMGLGNYGLACYDPRSGSLSYMNNELGYRDPRDVPTVHEVKAFHDGCVWFTLYGVGVARLNPSTRDCRLFSHDNSGFVPMETATSLFEDSSGNIYVGSSDGFGVRMVSGRETTVEDIECRIVGFFESKGHVYAVTRSDGILDVTASLGDSGSMVDKYKTGYPTLPPPIYNNLIVNALYKSGDDVWLGTDNAGIWRFDVRDTSFTNVPIGSDIAGLQVRSISCDRRGDLWFGSNSGLWHVCRDADGSNSAVRYSSMHGLPSDLFSLNSAIVSDRKLIFGNREGLVMFSPEEVISLGDRADSGNLHFGITRFLISGKEFFEYEESLREKISGGVNPSFSGKITLPSGLNNLLVEFSGFSYRNPDLTGYSYKLDGFDDDWNYTGSHNRTATYTNLPPGKYTLRLRASNDMGQWSPEIKELEVVVLTPWWASWWAIIGYCLILILTGVMVFIFVRKRVRERTRMRMLEMEKETSDRINQNKFVFFTNITHELLTPLTIISAGVDELCSRHPEESEAHDVIERNINRLIRHLQQILEFRKAESKNLRLVVSYGDISSFVAKEIESFGPLIRKRNQTLTFSDNPGGPVFGLYDSDKLDKVLYNLVSNAAKYSGENGKVSVSLARSEDSEHIVLKVSNTGKGIPKDKIPRLFKRFYEGEYRDFNTIGNGIGLSLTKDLVDLYHGEISIESSEGQGTTFTIQLPVTEGYFDSDEIRHGNPEPKILLGEKEDAIDSGSTEGSADEKAYTILLVEDNDELCQMMRRLLKKDYNVLTAANGEEACRVLAEERVSLIVTDVMMPVMDGYELIRFVKGSIDYSHIPVIILTAKHNMDDLKYGFEIGADAFLAKPFNLSVLYARIRNLLKTNERRAKDFKNQLVLEMNDLNYESADESFLKKAMECVNSHLSDPDFDVPQFADEMSVSKTTLYKKLKSLTGMSPNSFIRNIRLKASCKIMETHRDIRVSELAYSVGFNDPKYFSICFRREFGMSPTDYCERFPQMPSK